MADQTVTTMGKRKTGCQRRSCQLRCPQFRNPYGCFRSRVSSRHHHHVPTLILAVLRKAKTGGY